jgi:hypothetical protein
MYVSTRFRFLILSVLSEFRGVGSVTMVLLLQNAWGRFQMGSSGGSNVSGGHTFFALFGVWLCVPYMVYAKPENSILFSDKFHSNEFLPYCE